MEFVQPIRNVEKIEEVKNILKHQSYRDYFLFLTGINTGLRISDLLQLKVKDVRNKTHIILKEEKTDKKKRFPIAEIQDEIEEYTKNMQDEDYLFPSQRSGKPITRIQAYRIMNKAAAKAGLEEIGTHTMRKTFGYHHYKRLKDVAVLQKIFNHSAPSVTLRYIGIEQDEIDESLKGFKL
jgi:integrase